MRSGVVVAAVTVLALASCSGDDVRTTGPSSTARQEVADTSAPQPTGTSAGPSAPSSAPGSSDSVAPTPASTTAPSSGAEPSAPPTTVELPDGVEVAPVRPMAQAGIPSILAHGDELIELGVTEGRLAVGHGSTDAGAPIARFRTDVELDLVTSAASDGERIVVVGELTRGAIPVEVVWTSGDGGATWQPLDPFPLEEMTSPYASPMVELQGLAIADDTIVGIGSSRVEVDWAAYSREVLRQDHGDRRGLGSGGQGTVEVFFEDGFVLTVDPATVGVTAEELMGVTTVWTHDGAGWTLQHRPEWSPTGSVSVAHGPSGFATVVSVAPTTGPATGPPTAYGPRLLLSRDGHDWEVLPLPSSVRLDGGAQTAVTAGPLGYVAVGGAAVSFSPDGVTWTDSDVYPPVEPSSTMMGLTMPPPGGRGGFVVFVPDDAAMRSAGWAMWSPDGLAWSVVPLPAEAITASAAVVSEGALIVPYSAPDPLESIPEMPADRAALEAVIASAFDGTMTMPDGSPIGAPAYTTTDEAQCIASGVVDGIGIERVRQLRFGSSPWHLLGYALLLQIDLEDAEPIVQAFRRCAPNWELLAIRTATEGTDRISAPSLACARDALDDDVAEQLFIIELARPYDDGAPSPVQPDLGHLGQLFTALERCLTDAELGALDWN